MTDDENAANEQQEPPNKKDREKKRERCCGGFQEKTATAEEGERKFKGWSDDGHKAFLCGTQKDVASGKHDLWEKEF
jgi:hypothetical protein